MTPGYFYVGVSQPIGDGFASGERLHINCERGEGGAFPVSCAPLEPWVRESGFSIKVVQIFITICLH